MINNLIQDIKYGAQTVLRYPVFGGAVILALALGIGANTAIFSVISTVLLRPLPYKNSDRLVMLWEQNTKKGGNVFNVSYPDFADWRDDNKTFDEMAAYMYFGTNIGGDENPETIIAVLASHNLFSVLGVNPRLGRAFTPEDSDPGVNTPSVILSYGLWQRRFGSDPNIVGRTVRMHSRSLVIIGVMPQGFEFPLQYQRGGALMPKVDAWAPVLINPQNREGRGNHAYSVVARLKPGVSSRQAQAELDMIAGRLEREYPASNKDTKVKIIPLRQQFTGDVKTVLWVLFGAVGFVLLIACANVANLLLARATAREREMAMRSALGASRLGIIRQLLTETLLLALLGGALGYFLSIWGCKILVSLSTDPRISQATVDSRALLFTFLLSIVTGCIFGLAPALQASNPDLNSLLKENNRGSSGSSNRQRIRSLLVMAEVAFALILLIGAGVTLRSIVRMQDMNTGFKSENLLTAGVSLAGGNYMKPERVTEYYKQILERVQALPGVQSVGAVNILPLSGSNFSNSFNIEARPRAPGEVRVADYRAVSPDYFRTMGIPLLKGRTFTHQDEKDAPGVALINETLARRFFPDIDPIGQRIIIDTSIEIAVYGKAISREIVGIVGDIRHTGIDAVPRPDMYVPYQQNPQGMMLVIRTESDPNLLGTAIRNVVKSIDSDQLAFDIKTMAQLRAESIAQRRFLMLLLSIFALLALVLAVLGVYSVIAYAVSQRTHEIGIRMALGAKPRNILRMILQQGMVLVTVGTVIGAVAIIALNRIVKGFLYGVAVSDPITITVCSLLLLTTALLACLIPATKAVRLDPVSTLREE